MRFSVVIPTYNGAAYVEKTIRSVLNQNRAADEIIVSDDNSSDDTLLICEKYVEKISIYKNESGPSGFVNGWNNAIDKATGDYITILHQDDLLDPSFLYEMEQLIKNYPDVLHFFSTCNYIDDFGKTVGISYPDTGEIHRYSGLEYMKTYQNIGNPHIHRCPGVITHNSLFEKIRFNPEAGHIADDDFFYRLGKYTDVVGLLKPMASYREHQQSETGKIGGVDLAKRLRQDYIFQLKQWKNDPFLDDEALKYFKFWAKKYVFRCIYYDLKLLNMKELFKSLKYICKL